MNKNHTESLFGSGKTVMAIIFSEYLDRIVDSEKYPEFIALPPLQRGFVWKPSQIVNLWDSLLRGMPIGSLLFSRLEKSAQFIAITDLASRSMSEAVRDGYNLLDGQQRTLAMLLGWPDGSNDTTRRIWIDFGNKGIKGAPFSIRITTQTHPFGFSPSDPDRKLSVSERRTARDDFNNRYKEFEGKFDYELNLDFTRPKSSSAHTLLLTELWRMWRHSPDNWEEFILSKLGNPESDLVKIQVKRFGQALQRLSIAQLALILVPDLHSLGTANEEQGDDPLVVLFDRIATGGARLTADEHLFALIKNTKPEVHTIVHGMHKHVGHFLRANDIVMTAIRIAAVHNEVGQEDIAEPKARDFHRYLKNEKLLKVFTELISPAPIHNYAPLHQALDALSKLLRYSGGRDIGLPRAAMPLLGKELLQVLLFWMLRKNLSPIKEEAFLNSRDEIVRFVLFWILCVKDPAKASHQAFKFLMKYPDAELFPGKALYGKLTGINTGQDAVALKLFSPEKLPVWEKSEHILRTWEERFDAKGKEKGPYELYLQFWEKRKRLLLWLQRSYVQDKFSGYDPIAGRDEAKPYDYDHICPQQNWSDLSRSVRRDALTEKPRKRFENLWARRLLGNSIGNYRILDSSENRHDQDDSPRKKLALGEHGEVVQSNPVLIDSAIDFEDVQLWRDASGEDNAGNKWDDARLNAFQEAVERRSISLYRRFFNGLKFDIWEAGHEAVAEEALANS
jgi:hypothetical protein